MRIDQLSPTDAVSSLGSGSSGLTHAEAARRRGEFGRNVVQEVAREPLLLRLMKEFIGFFSVILWVAAALAFFAEWSVPSQGMAKIGYAIVIVILVSGVFSFWQEFRVEQSLAALRKLLGVVQLRVTRTAPDEVALVDNGSPFFQSWCVHESIRWRGSKAAWE